MTERSNSEKTRRRCRWAGWLAVLAVATIVLAACGSGSSPPHVASLGTTTTEGTTPRHSSGGSITTASNDNATALVDEWAACERSQGDPNQADPIIDAHGVINITVPSLQQGGVTAGDPHDVTGMCSQYLSAAQRVLRAAYPVADPLGVTNTATIVAFAGCMRANGIPNYPYPSGPNDSETNFNGTGVDPNSPQVEKVNDLCGKKLGLPAWWINGWGPPGDVSVSSAGLPAQAPACVFAKSGCGSGVPISGGSGGTASHPGSGG